MTNNNGQNVGQIISTIDTNPIPSSRCVRVWASTMSVRFNLRVAQRDTP